MSVKTLGDTEETSARLEDKYGKRWKTIGRGAYGTVSIFRKSDTTGQNGALFAVKEFHRRPRQHVTAYRDRILGEITLVGGIRHANIVRILDLFEVGKDTFLEVMEYCSGGDVFTLVQAAGPLVAVEADCFLKQLVRGVKYLHEMDVAHCDLKPENLLLTPQGVLKITDFGFCHDLVPPDGDGVKLLSGMRGSLPYIAPEEHTDKEFDARAADVWACGVIYMFMRSARYLWRSAQADDEDYLTYVKDRRVEKGYAPIEHLDHVRMGLLLMVFSANTETDSKPECGILYARPSTFSEAFSLAISQIRMGLCDSGLQEFRRWIINSSRIFFEGK